MHSCTRDKGDRKMTKLEINRNLRYTIGGLRLTLERVERELKSKESDESRLASLWIAEEDLIDTVNTLRDVFEDTHYSRKFINPRGGRNA